MRVNLFLTCELFLILLKFCERAFAEFYPRFILRLSFRALAR